MTPEEYMEKLREVQRTCDLVKDDLDRAIYKMQRRLDSGFESMEQQSRLAVLAGRDYVRLADDCLLKVALEKIEY